jgi:MYXO-CTERM domain-containing protein
VPVLAIDQDRAVVAVRDEAHATGAQVFTYGATGWVRDPDPLVPDGMPSFDAAAIAVAGDSIALASDFACTGGGQGSCTFVFHRESSGWKFQQAITSLATVATNQIGASLAIDGNTLLVGVFRYHAVFAYVWNGTTWTEQQVIHAPPEEADGGGGDPLLFGHAVALTGDTAIIGSAASGDVAGVHGRAYVFTRQAGAWKVSQKLVASSPSSSAFGTALALSGDRVVVADPITPAAYVFANATSAWAEEAKITFGSLGSLPVGLSGNTALFATFEPSGETGVHVFNRQGTVWTESQLLQPLGYPAISGKNALISTLESDPSQANQGHVYPYRLLAEVGEQCAKDDDCASRCCSNGSCAACLPDAGADASRGTREAGIGRDSAGVAPDGAGDSSSSTSDSRAASGGSNGSGGAPMVMPEAGGMIGSSVGTAGHGAGAGPSTSSTGGTAEPDASNSTVDQPITPNSSDGCGCRSASTDPAGRVPLVVFGSIAFMLPLVRRTRRKPSQ